MTTLTVQVRQKGVITLPIELRRQYSLNEGDFFTLVDLGDGAFLLVPLISQVARLGDQAGVALMDVDVSLEDLLDALDQERTSYYQEHYAKA